MLHCRLITVPFMEIFSPRYHSIFHNYVELRARIMYLCISVCLVFRYNLLFISPFVILARIIL